MFIAGSKTSVFFLNQQWEDECDEGAQRFFQKAKFELRKIANFFSTGKTPLDSHTAWDKYLIGDQKPKSSCSILNLDTFTPFASLKLAWDQNSLAAVQSSSICVL